MASTVGVWVKAARVRTLPAAMAPVFVGTALAAREDQFDPLIFAAAVVSALFIQIGTNLSNDYSDARRGADTEDRLGPVRVTAGGLVPPRQVLIATWASFATAVAVGLYLVVVAGWELLVVGGVSILAGILYTGGPRPYGYEGLGELFVFLFFGLVAVTGSYFIQTQEVTLQALALSVPVGLLACAILVVNNFRDIDTDRRTGKRTLAVRLGRARARVLYYSLIAGAFAAVVLAWLLCDVPAGADLALLAAPLAAHPVNAVRTRTDGAALNRALGDTAQLQLGFCVLLSIGLLAL